MTNEKLSKETEKIVVTRFPRESVPVLVIAATCEGSNVCIEITEDDGVKVTAMTDVKEDP
jgi:hypothetical protein